MRSLYVRILLASCGTVLLSLAGFLGVFFAFSNPALTRAFRGFEAVIAEDAADAFTREGASLAAAYLKRIDGTLPMTTHYLVDAHGGDVVTGTDHSTLLRTNRDSEGHVIRVSPSANGRYKMVTATAPPFGLSDFLPYYVLILGAIAFVCWLLAVGIVSPIREMVSVVNEFGHGHLTARARVERRDEIGELAQSFNEMASRIETLVTAERRLLQDVSHELRSPLTRLSMAIELSRTAPDPGAAADRLQREADRLTHLVGALLEVTRLEDDTGSTLAGVVNVPAVVRAVAADCDLEAEARGCRLAVETMIDRHTSGNPELLRRAFENALRNAIRYAPRGTLVEVRCEERGPDLVVSVRDFGPGVPDEALPQLGNAFYRVDASRDPSTGGLGLGLAIARRAIQLHHGTWSAENAHPGLRLIMTIPGLSAEDGR